MAENKDDVKENHLQIGVIDAWENHINLNGANFEVKKINMVS